MTTKKSKAKARKKATELLASLPAKRVRESSDEIAERVINSEIFKQAKTLFVYISFGNEVSTKGIIEAAKAVGKNVYSPQLPTSGRWAEANPDDLDLDKNDIDLTIVPCLAVDKRGARLGRGGGYYDRFLTGYKGRFIALCHGELVFDELPTEEHDVRVEVITSYA
jgi:5-formyltetrahydrofolate cyclo-ligase